MTDVAVKKKNACAMRELDVDNLNINDSHSDSIKGESQMSEIKIRQKEQT